MSSTASTHPGSRATLIAGMTPAELFCRVVGPTLILAGIIGFFVNSSFAAGDSLKSDDLIVFGVNGWHNVVHILSGLLLLAFARGARPARTGVLVFSVAYLVVTIWGFIDGNDILSLIPTDTADNVLHLLLTAVGFGAYALTKPDAGPEGAVRRG
jgi:Domain of unknown function (DUF4383)